MNGQIFKDLKEAFIDVAGAEEAKKLVREALEAGVTPSQIIDTMSEGLEAVGRRYEAGDYFLSELIMAGLMARDVSELLQPHLSSKKEVYRGKVVIGTVKGDLHDIGKNIVLTMLSSVGFNVFDLGIDVSAERFIEAVRVEKPDILALSCLMTISMEEMRKTIRMLEKEGFKNGVKVMVGGRPISQVYADEIGADGYGRDAIEAVRVAESLLGRK